MSRLAILSLAAALTIPACASDSPINDELAGDDEAGKNDSEAGAPYYLITSGLSGGVVCKDGPCFTAARVNRAMTDCGAGFSAAQCFLGKIDWAPIGAPQDITVSAEQKINAGVPVLVRGSLSKGADDLGITLTAAELWLPQASEGFVDGVFVYAHHNGLICEPGPNGERPPCHTFDEQKLNSTRSSTIAYIDYRPSGASFNVIERADGQLFSQGVIAVGERVMDGDLRVRTANQFYTRVRPLD